MLSKIEERLKDVMQKLDQSVANHNALLGAKMTLEALYKDFQDIEPVVHSVVDAVMPNEAEVIDGVLNEIDHVMNQVNSQ